MTAALQKVPMLAVHEFPAKGQRASLPLVLIHGWGSDSKIWYPLLALLNEDRDVLCVDLPGFGQSRPGTYDLDLLLAMFDQQLPERFNLLGWSLGGMLATAFAGAYQGRVSKLLTVASNACFVARPGWPDAMERNTFEDFRRFFDADSAACLKQFAALQARGDKDERQLLRALRQQAGSPSDTQQGYQQSWSSALGLLGALDNRETLAKLQCPALHVFGAQDALVPACASKAVARLNPSHHVELMEAVAHVPQLSAVERLYVMMAAFLADVPVEGDKAYQIDKSAVAQSFSRCAASYDQVAELQRQVGKTLLEQLPQKTVKIIADLGCGTGFFTGHLGERYPGSYCLGLDLAEGMIRYARDKHGTSENWLVGDSEQLPLVNAGVDLIFSNFAFQWCGNLVALKKELARVLSPGGQLVFSTLGPRTLWELRQAWGEVDDQPHVNRFKPFEEVMAALEQSGLRVKEKNCRDYVRYYPDFRELARELKSLGAHNLNQGRSRTLTPRRHLEVLKQAYENVRQPQGLPATWEVITVVAQKP